MGSLYLISAVSFSFTQFSHRIPSYQSSLVVLCCFLLGWWFAVPAPPLIWFVLLLFQMIFLDQINYKIFDIPAWNSWPMGCFIMYGLCLCAKGLWKEWEVWTPLYDFLQETQPMRAHLDQVPFWIPEMVDLEVTWRSQRAFLSFCPFMICRWYYEGLVDRSSFSLLFV